MFEFFGRLVNKTKKEPDDPIRDVFIKHLNSKGPRGALVSITVDAVQQGYIVDFDGYKNEIVLFLRKNKKDR